MHFTKWNGCGNDFILINALTIKDINPIVNECVHLCDRHFGIGADGIIFVLPSLQAFKNETNLTGLLENENF